MPAAPGWPPAAFGAVGRRAGDGFAPLAPCWTAASAAAPAEPGWRPGRPPMVARGCAGEKGFMNGSGAPGFAFQAPAASFSDE